MIVFPDQRVGGKQSIPFVTMGLIAVLATLLVLERLQVLPISLGDPILFGMAAILLVLVSGPDEFALGRLVFSFALFLSLLIALGLWMVTLRARPEGLEWFPHMAGVMVGLTAGLFRTWQIRPLYLVPGVVGLLRFPAYLPLLLWGGVLAILYGVEFQSARTVILHAQCSAAGFVVGMAMNALSLIRPSMFTGEYATRIIREGLAEVHEHMRDVRLSKARRLLSRLASLDPSNLELQRTQYAVWKYNPTHPEFHAAAAALLDQKDTDTETNQMVDEIFRDYMAVTQGKPNLPVGMHLALSKRFARTHKLEDAANIVNVYLQRNVQHPDLPEALLTLAEGYVLTDRPTKAAHYADTLLALFPDAKAARSAKSLLNRLASQLPSE